MHPPFVSSSTRILFSITFILSLLQLIQHARSFTSPQRLQAAAEESSSSNMQANNMHPVHTKHHQFTTTLGLVYSRKIPGHDKYSGISPRTFQSPNLDLEQALDMFHNSAPGPDNKHQSDRVIFLDGTWYHKGARSGREDWLKGPRIPGSLYWDMEEHSASSIRGSSTESAERSNVPLAHMLPTLEQFRAVCESLHIAPSECADKNGKRNSSTNSSASSAIIIYASRSEAAFLPRVWFTFWNGFQQLQQEAGFDPTHQFPKLYILQSSLQDWIKAGGPIDMTEKSESDLFSIEQAVSTRDGLQPQNFVNKVTESADMRTSINVATFQNVKSVVANKLSESNAQKEDASKGRKSLVPPTAQIESAVLLDARGSSFTKGHMPGAVHVPYSSLSSSLDDGSLSQFVRLKSPGELRLVFADAGVDPLSPNPIICTCGSGVSACSVFLALLECGRPLEYVTKMYDGSWQEWSARKEE